MVGLLLLHRIYNLSDEGVVEQWIANPFYQYFCGEARFHGMDRESNECLAGLLRLQPEKALETDQA